MQAERDEFRAATKSFRISIRSDPKYICPYLPLAMLERGAGDWEALIEVTDRMSCGRSCAGGAPPLSKNSP
jgi:hypothetical protein